MRNFNDYFPEQDETFDKEAWAKEKQAARDGVYKLAADTAVGICKSGKKYRSYLDVQAAFPGKSVNNALLILAQNKDARQIGTRDFWRDQGLYVKREEMQRTARPAPRLMCLRCTTFHRLMPAQGYKSPWPMMTVC